MPRNHLQTPYEKWSANLNKSKKLTFKLSENGWWNCDICPTQKFYFPFELKDHYDTGNKVLLSYFKFVENIPLLIQGSRALILGRWEHRVLRLLTSMIYATIRIHIMSAVFSKVVPIIFTTALSVSPRTLLNLSLTYFIC